VRVGVWLRKNSRLNGASVLLGQAGIAIKKANSTHVCLVPAGGSADTTTVVVSL
jgi:hypothetical protein